MAARKKAAELPPETVEKIRADIAVWHPGIWDESNHTRPACTCGLSLKASRAMAFDWDGVCQRHSRDS